MSKIWGKPQNKRIMQRGKAKVSWTRKHYKFFTKIKDLSDDIETVFSTMSLITQNKIPFVNNIYVASNICSNIIDKYLLDYIDASSLLPEKIISFSKALNQEIMELASLYNKKLIMSNVESKYFHIELNDTYFIQLYDDRYGKNNYNLYCEQEQFNKVKKCLSTLFWKKYDSVITIKAENNYKSYGDKDIDIESRVVSFKKMEKITGFYPKQYYEFFEYVDKFIKNNVSRSIVLYGAPGTGKTILSKLITQQMELKTLHISINDFGVSCADAILNFVDLFAPEVIVIDDFDRLKNSDNLLSLIEELHKKLKIIIVSVNDKNFAKDNLALIRPERFDKFIEVKNIDEKVALQLLGDDNKEFLERAKDYPAAYIKEAGTSLRIIGKENSDQIFKELDERVKAQDAKYNY